MEFVQNHKYSFLSKILKYIFIVIIAFTLVTPFLVSAADSSTPGKNNTSDSSTPGAATKITGINAGIQNPINVDTIPAFIEKVLNIVLVIGVPIVALAIIYSGFLFVKARGNSEEIKKAKSALMYTIIGAFLLLGAWVLATAIGATVDDIISTT